MRHGCGAMNGKNEYALTLLFVLYVEKSVKKFKTGRGNKKAGPV